MRPLVSFVTFTSITAFAPNVEAVVTEYWFRQQWQSVVGPYTAITFQGYPKGTLIDKEYAVLGVIFPDGNDVIEYHPLLINDGVGLLSNDLVHGIITMQFDEPRTAVACDFLGIMDIWLYANGQLIWDSVDFFDSASRFGGLTSTVPFDRVLIRDPSN
jgi:hypothetical protein